MKTSVRFFSVLFFSVSVFFAGQNPVLAKANEKAVNALLGCDAHKTVEALTKSTGIYKLSRIKQLKMQMEWYEGLSKTLVKLAKRYRKKAENSLEVLGALSVWNDAERLGFSTRTVIAAHENYMMFLQNDYYYRLHEKCMRESEAAQLSSLTLLGIIKGIKFLGGK